MLPPVRFNRHSRDSRQRECVIMGWPAPLERSGYDRRPLRGVEERTDGYRGFGDRSGQELVQLGRPGWIGPGCVAASDAAEFGREFCRRSFEAPPSSLKHQGTVKKCHQFGPTAQSRLYGTPDSRSPALRETSAIASNAD